ncbi:MAG: hypothetical protein KDD40_07810 [Bdellovibrionales bacterium]|nr:hypothetical protein [Bdellovibrionales bacterium]
MKILISLFITLNIISLQSFAESSGRFIHLGPKTTNSEDELITKVFNLMLKATTNPNLPSAEFILTTQIYMGAESPMSENKVIVENGGVSNREQYMETNKAFIKRLTSGNIDYSKVYESWLLGTLAVNTCLQKQSHEDVPLVELLGKLHIPAKMSVARKAVLNDDSSALDSYIRSIISSKTESASNNEKVSMATGDINEATQAATLFAKVKDLKINCHLIDDINKFKEIQAVVDQTDFSANTTPQKGQVN